MYVYWVARVQTQAAAQWACETASHMVRDLYDSLSDFPQEAGNGNVAWKEVELKHAIDVFAPPSSTGSQSDA